MYSRRHLLQAGIAAAALPTLGRAAGPVTADWSSLVAGYRTPDWFRDAKFGIWAHWSAQCVPEYGDWYGRQMYIQGNRVYDHHLRTYGHPADTGFMEIENLWKAERWEPATLIARYKQAGARYFMALANHHDNLDTFDSAHHAWNTLRVGPKRDIVGTWEKAARAQGLRFGVSNHSAHSWHWWQTAYGYDAEGPRRGQRYDAYRLTKADGAGTWWEGLDPQQLYNGRYDAPPAGIGSIKALNAWHDARDGQWLEAAPPAPRGPGYVRNWLLRQQDLVSKYRPDIVYFDDYRLPFAQTGIAAAADYYNQSLAWHGAIDVVLTAKILSPYQRYGIVEDIERGYAEDIKPQPWQTCTCIGNWHYDRALFERHGYQPAKKVVQRLCDIVSKNGNLLLSIPQRGDGTIDSDEEQILADLGRWFAVNGDAIYGTRPWRMFGEGPSKPPKGMQSEDQMQPFSARDVRFTVGSGALHAFLLDWPTGETAIHALGRSKLGSATIERITLIGGGAVAFRHDAAALRFTLPPAADGQFVPGVRIEGRGLV